MKRIERVDLAVYSRQLRRRAVWCGLVSALAVLFCVLNAIPPVPVRYEVTGKVLVEPPRVQGLVQNLKRTTSWDKPTVLRDFQVLARSQTESSVGFVRFHDTDRMLLKLRSQWNHRCSAADFRIWVETVTQSTAKIQPDSSLASEVRMARWELNAAEHYRKHSDFLASTSPASNEGARFQLAGSDGQRPAGQLVSDLNSSGQIGIPEDHESGVENDGSESQQVDRRVEVARQRLESLESKIDESVSSAAGNVTLMDSPVIVPVSDRIPLWMAFSVIVVLTSVGSAVGWYHLRLQSGGYYDPQEVAGQLASKGLAVLATVRLPSDQLDSADWLEIASRQASGAGRSTGRNLILLSEGVLGIWCFLILARVLLDPMWRLVLLDSPLAAFGRLVAGLP